MGDCDQPGLFGSCCAPPDDPLQAIYEFEHQRRENQFYFPEVLLSGVGAVPSDQWSNTQTDAWQSVITGTNGIDYRGSVVTDAGTLDDSGKDTDNWRLSGLRGKPRDVIGAPQNFLTAPYMEDDVTLGSAPPSPFSETQADLWCNAGRWSAQGQIATGSTTTRVNSITTSAGFVSRVIMWLWPISVGQTMITAHGIHRFKISYKTYQLEGKSINTPIGTFVDSYESDPFPPVVRVADTDSFSLPTNAFDVWYGSADVSNAADPVECLDEIINGTGNTDGFVTPDPDTSNTSNFVVKLAAVGHTATGTDNYYYLAVAPNPVRLTADPFAAFPGVGSQTNYRLLSIPENPHLIRVTELEVQDSGGSAIETYTV